MKRLWHAYSTPLRNAHGSRERLIARGEKQSVSDKIMSFAELYRRRLIHNVPELGTTFTKRLQWAVR